jgi:hypothetical protein
VCLSDCLTKSNAKPDMLVKAVETGVLPRVDTHPPFRELLQHRAFVSWASKNLQLRVHPTELMFLDMPHCCASDMMNSLNEME